MFINARKHLNVWGIKTIVLPFTTKEFDHVIPRLFLLELRNTKVVR